MEKIKESVLFLKNADNTYRVYVCLNQGTYLMSINTMENRVKSCDWFIHDLLEYKYLGENIENKFAKSIIALVGDDDLGFYIHNYLNNGKETAKINPLIGRGLFNSPKVKEYLNSIAG